jgi:hypothetical protein
MRQRRSRTCTPQGVPALQTARSTKAREQGLGYSRVEQPNARQRRRRGRSRGAAPSCRAHLAACSSSTHSSSSFNGPGARGCVCSRHVGGLAAVLSPRAASVPYRIAEGVLRKSGRVQGVGAAASRGHLLRAPRPVRGERAFPGAI